jgi:peptide/nickel transport system ATP-binding protein
MASPRALGEGPALEVRGLTASYGQQVVVSEVSLAVSAGHVLGLAGESGCGKSTLALAAMGFRQGGLEVRSGQSLVGADDLLQLDARQLRARWGATISYVPQGAAASLNPAHTVASHFRLLFRHHLGLRRRASDRLATEWLERVHLPAEALDRYPHQFSGGQQQRISLALALGCQPRVVILDEPTTGLDVTTQAQITTMLRQMVDELGIAAIYVSHDLALLGGIADELAVMYAGEIIESGPAGSVLSASRHPYSRALLAAAPSVGEERVPVGIPGSPPSSVIEIGCSYAPRCDRSQDRCTVVRPPLVARGDASVRCHFPVDDVVSAAARGASTTRREAPDPSTSEMLSVKGLVCRYQTAAGARVVVDGLDLVVGAGETLAVVGESGSGKSTLLRTLAGIHHDSSGEIRFAGEILPIAARRRPPAARGAIQLIFQNSDLALNPRRTVGDAIDRSLKLFRSDIGSSQRHRETAALLDLVHLPASSIERLPGQLSGGQRQRVAFARAFASRPKVLLCDEVTSALDVSVQATILALLSDLSTQFATAVIFVSHDLAVVRSIADRIAVMQHGQIRETATTRNLFAHPQSAYTRQLLASAPSLTDAAPVRAGADAAGA